MPSVNLYVPKHLYQRLDELPEDLSLSGIFRAALEHELAERKEPAPEPAHT